MSSIAFLIIIGVLYVLVTLFSLPLTPPLEYYCSVFLPFTRLLIDSDQSCLHRDRRRTLSVKSVTGSVPNKLGPGRVVCVFIRRCTGDQPNLAYYSLLRISWIARPFPSYRMADAKARQAALEE